jgi:hypothetical protein
LARKKKRPAGSGFDPCHIASERRLREEPYHPSCVDHALYASPEGTAIRKRIGQLGVDLLLCYAHHWHWSEGPTIDEKPRTAFPSEDRIQEEIGGTAWNIRQARERLLGEELIRQVADQWVGSGQSIPAFQPGTALVELLEICRALAVGTRNGPPSQEKGACDGYKGGPSRGERGPVTGPKHDPRTESGSLGGCSSSMQSSGPVAGTPQPRLIGRPLGWSFQECLTFIKRREATGIELAGRELRAGPSRDGHGIQVCAVVGEYQTVLRSEEEIAGGLLIWARARTPQDVQART